MGTYDPIVIDFGTTGVTDYTPTWIQGIKAAQDAAIYPYAIVSTQWGLTAGTGGDPDTWVPSITVALDPNYTYAEPVPESVSLEYTLYYLYQ